MSPSSVVSEVEVGLECVEATGPRGAERCEPVVDLHERLGDEAVDAALCVPAHSDETQRSDQLRVIVEPFVS
jgi:hypothetical protein